MFARCPFFNRGNLEKSKLHEKEFILTVARTIISTECFFFGFSGLFEELVQHFLPNLEKTEKILEKKSLNIKKSWVKLQLSGKICPTLKKKFSWEMELKLFFFPSRKVTGKGFEQFCFHQKSPEQSRNSILLILLFWQL